MTRDVSVETVSATVSMLLTKALVHPIDTLKCRIQARPFTSWSQFRDHWRGQWWGQCYNGVGVKISLYLPYQALYMTLYTSTYNATYLPMVSALCADIGSSPIRVPMEALKVRLQSNMYPTTVDAVKHLRLFELRRLFVTQTLMCDVPYSVVQWGCYEMWRECNLTETTSRHFSGASFVAGFMCGSVTAVVTCPMEVVRTRVLVQKNDASAGCGGPAVVLRQILREEGALRLWRGAMVRMLWVSVNSGVFFGLYENLRQALKR